MNNKYSISFSWDDEAEVWIATSADISGLILEDESFDRLVARVKLVVPELLSMVNELHGNILLDYNASRCESVAVDGKIKSRHTANGILKRAGINFKL